MNDSQAKLILAAAEIVQQRLDRKQHYNSQIDALTTLLSELEKKQKVMMQASFELLGSKKHGVIIQGSVAAAALTHAVGHLMRLRDNGDESLAKLPLPKLEP